MPSELPIVNMAKRSMSKVMANARNLNAHDIPLRDSKFRLSRPKSLREHLRQVSNPKRVFEAVVPRVDVDVVRDAELVQSAETLHLGSVEEGEG